MTTNPIARAALGTPRAPGAIAAIHLAGNISEVLENLGVQDVNVGNIALRDIAGIDHVVLAVLDDHTAILTPHGGPAVVSAILDALASAGAEIDHADPRTLYPEAEDETEALALDALARAASPRATKLLLDQPRRWREWGGTQTAEMQRVSAQLNHLITPPTVVAAGRPNIGKSTLLNVLAGRTVSIVADEPGVTRDHVGALLELDGLTIRWIDAPGLRDPTNDTEARAIALVKEIITNADLILLCADSSATPITPLDLSVDADRCLILGLRADLGELPEADLSTTASTGTGLTALAKAVRGRLVPDSALNWPGPWRFDDRLLPR